MARISIILIISLLFILLFPISSQATNDTKTLKGDVLSSDPDVDGLQDPLWNQVPSIESEFRFPSLQIPLSIRFAYFKSSLYILAEISDISEIDNSSKFKILFDLDESSSLTQGDLLVEIEMFANSNNLSVGKYLLNDGFNLTSLPNYAQTKVGYNSEKWVIELQLVTFNENDTFIARENLFGIISYERNADNQIQTDSALDTEENHDLITVGTWDQIDPIVFPPLDAIISVYHSGIENIVKGDTLVKIVTYISIGTSGPIENIRIVLKSPLPIQAFTGISSEIIANSLLQRYSITVTAREAPEGGIIRLTYFLNTANRTSDQLVWEPLNISYYNTVNRYRTLLAGGEYSLDFTTSSSNGFENNGSSLLSKYNITIIEDDFSLMDIIFPTFYRNLVLDITGILIIIFGLTLFRSWWITGKEVIRYRKKGELLIIKIIQLLGKENHPLAQSFARRAYLDLKDTLNKVSYKLQFRAAKPEDLSYHWTEFLYQLEKRLKVYYSDHENYDDGLQLIFSNFDLFHDKTD